MMHWLNHQSLYSIYTDRMRWHRLPHSWPIIHIFLSKTLNGLRIFHSNLQNNVHRLFIHCQGFRGLLWSGPATYRSHLSSILLLSDMPRLTTDLRNPLASVCLIPASSSSHRPQPLSISFTSIPSMMPHQLIHILSEGGRPCWVSCERTVRRDNVETLQRRQSALRYMNIVWGSAPERTRSGLFG